MNPYSNAPVTTADILQDLIEMGFDNPDEPISGFDAVEYLCELYSELAKRKDNGN